MNRASLNIMLRTLGLLVVLFAALPANAGHRAVTKWKAICSISGEANPFTTAAYFPRPLVVGELVEMVFTLDTGVAPGITGSYANYPGAITSVKVSGSDWSIKMRAPLGSGAIAVTNDDPVYGDSLIMTANTPELAGKTWYQVEIDLRNPGGPDPGVGPWPPFTSLALPKSPPPLGLLPSQIIYLGARRDLPGQPIDGGIYYGQILSLTAVKRGDDQDDEDDAADKYD
jgi:hypothetical protein